MGKYVWCVNNKLCSTNAGWHMTVNVLIQFYPMLASHLLILARKCHTFYFLS